MVKNTFMFKQPEKGILHPMTPLEENWPLPSGGKSTGKTYSSKSNITFQKILCE